MIHQPLGGAKGQATDIMIVAEEIIKIKKLINEILASNTNKSIEQISKDVERDFYMDTSSAVEYGLIDQVLTNKNS